MIKGRWFLGKLRLRAGEKRILMSTKLTGIHALSGVWMTSQRAFSACKKAYFLGVKKKRTIYY